MSLTLLCGSRCRRAPSHVALGRTDNVSRKAITARQTVSSDGPAKHERWNLRDIVLVSSWAGLVLAADTNTLMMSTVYTMTRTPDLLPGTLDRVALPSGRRSRVPEDPG